jgi:site-specific DNA recombinase
MIASYARVSTDEQASRGYGLDAQRHEIRRFAKAKGYTITDDIADDASGATLERPGLAKLREGARAGRYERILVHAPDRLARRLALQLLLLDEFKRAGVAVEFVTTPTEDTAEGRLSLNILGTIAEFEREKIKQRTLYGKLAKARAGKLVTPGNYPYGYRPDPAKPGHLMVHEIEAEVVRLVFRLVVDEGKSVRGTMHELRRLGLRGARGPWSTTSVRRILTDPRYQGQAFHNRKHHAASDWIAIPIPPIVTADRARAALVHLAKNRADLVGRPANFVYLLKSLIRCGTCGHRLIGASSSGRRKYRHSRDGKAGTCARLFSFSADSLEGTVKATITAALRDPAVLRQGVEAYEASRGATDVELQSRVAHLAKQIEKIRRDERRLIDLVVGDREQGEMVQEKLRGLAAQRGPLAEQLRVAEEKVARHGGENKTDAIERLCMQARRGLDKLTDGGWRALLREIVDEVRIAPDRSVTLHGLLPDTAHDIGPTLSTGVQALMQLDHEGAFKK